MSRRVSSLGASYAGLPRVSIFFERWVVGSGLEMTWHNLVPTVVFLQCESLGLHRQMHLVLKRRVAIDREQRGIVRHRAKQRLYPGPVALGKIAQHVAVHQFLDPGMADAEPHPAIVVADMGGDRAQSVVP